MLLSFQTKARQMRLWSKSKATFQALSLPVKIRGGVDKMSDSRLQVQPNL